TRAECCMKIVCHACFPCQRKMQRDYPSVAKPCTIPRFFIAVSLLPTSATKPDTLLREDTASAALRLRTPQVDRMHLFFPQFLWGLPLQPRIWPLRCLKC